MKKRLFAMIMALVLIMLCACGSDAKTGNRGNGTKTVNDILNDQAKQQNNADPKDSRPAESDVIESSADPAESSAGSTKTESSSSEALPIGNVQPTEEPVEYDKVDIDLTTMSSTMVYSEVYNMMSNPDNYVGKIVKMKGTSGYFVDETKNMYYFACVIQDATACCSQGIEYELNKNYKIPVDYPEMDSEVTVVGRFETYIEGDYKYLTLKNSNLLENKS